MSISINPITDFSLAFLLTFMQKKIVFLSKILSCNSSLCNQPPAQFLIPSVIGLSTPWVHYNQICQDTSICLEILICEDTPFCLDSLIRPETLLCPESPHCKNTLVCPINNCLLPFSCCLLQNGNCIMPITNCILPMINCKLPITNDSILISSQFSYWT